MLQIPVLPPIQHHNEVWEVGGDLLFCDPDFERIKELVRDAYRVARNCRNFIALPAVLWSKPRGGASGNPRPKSEGGGGKNGKGKDGKKKSKPKHELNTIDQSPSGGGGKKEKGKGKGKGKGKDGKRNGPPISDHTDVVVVLDISRSHRAPGPWGQGARL
eukprot:SAG11_NODE_1460_length_4870_cov_13.894571_4_plen_160_part_00